MDDGCLIASNIVQDGSGAFLNALQTSSAYSGDGVGAFCGSTVLGLVHA